MGIEAQAPIALVTGASRGVGKGVVLGLVEAGFRTYATGRSIDRSDLPDSVRRLSCDHTQDDQTGDAFRVIENECGHLDLLVNAAWGGYERLMENGQFTWLAPFCTARRSR